MARDLLIDRDMEARVRDVSGRWQNQHGSVMELRLLEGGRLTGTFKSGVGLTSPGEVFEIVGYCSGDLVSFVVNFAKYESLTSWSGHFADGENGAELHTMWHMVASAREERNSWKGIWTGADVFRREVVEQAGTDFSGRIPSHPVSWRDSQSLLGAMAAVAGSATD